MAKDNKSYDLLMFKYLGQKVMTFERKVQKTTRGNLSYIAKLSASLQPKSAIFQQGAVYE